MGERIELDRIVVDADGVPALVQWWTYLPMSMTIKFRLFNDACGALDVECLCPGVQLIGWLSRMQWLQIENSLNRHVMDNWSRYGKEKSTAGEQDG